jgi:cyclase
MADKLSAPVGCRLMKNVFLPSARKLFSIFAAGFVLLLAALPADATIDAKKIAPDKWGVLSHGGRKDTGLDAIEWAKRAVSLGAGEIVLNSIDADGTKAGFDLVITRRISESVGVPVVASGGAGSLEHMADVLLEGKADAVLAASIFHFGTYTVGDVKQFLAKQNIPVRL